MTEYTDKEMLDFLERLNAEKKYTGKCVLRVSAYGRGWRLHETSSWDEGSDTTVRGAIGKFMAKQEG